MLESSSNGAIEQVEYMIEQELLEHVDSGGDREHFISALANLTDADGRTPLHYASCYGHRKVAETLLQAGADSMAVDCDGFTALHFATRWNRPAVADYLIWLEAVNVNQRDRWGQTPLHVAAAAGHLELADALVWRKAGIHLVDDEGKRPLDLARDQETIDHFVAYDHGAPSEATRLQRQVEAEAEAVAIDTTGFEYLDEETGEVLDSEIEQLAVAEHVRERFGLVELTDAMFSTIAEAVDANGAQLPCAPAQAHEIFPFDKRVPIQLRADRGECLAGRAPGSRGMDERQYREFLHAFGAAHNLGDSHGGPHVYGHS
jgi:hypothetical protein